MSGRKGPPCRADGTDKETEAQEKGTCLEKSQSPFLPLPWPLSLGNVPSLSLSWVIESCFPLTRKGPCSVRKPSKELQPGPPLSQSTTGLLLGSFWDSTNLGGESGPGGCRWRDSFQPSLLPGSLRGLQDPRPAVLSPGGHSSAPPHSALGGRAADQ